MLSAPNTKSKPFVIHAGEKFAQYLKVFSKFRHFFEVFLQSVVSHIIIRSTRGKNPLLSIRNYTHHTPMDNAEQNHNVAPAPSPAPSPSDDTKNRLCAARQFAAEQYEKLCAATATQVENVRQYTDEARKQINEGWNATCARAKNLHEAGEEYVKSNPTGCMLGAVGVGLILGLLLGNRR